MGGAGRQAGVRTCLLDEVLVDPAAEVVPAIPPAHHNGDPKGQCLLIFRKMRGKKRSFTVKIKGTDVRVAVKD